VRHKKLRVQEVPAAELSPGLLTPFGIITEDAVCHQADYVVVFTSTGTHTFTGDDVVQVFGVVGEDITKEHAL
jgi:hypothetical protein